MTVLNIVELTIQMKSHTTQPACYSQFTFTKQLLNIAWEML